jgi:membrane protein CcdC involved in cytochrome C biogenesis
MAWRVRETTRPVTQKKIIIPPLGMSTGLFMFAHPATRIPVSWAVAAFLLGVLVLSYPLMKTSVLTRREGTIFLQRSPAFLWILVGLVIVRLVARSYVEDHVSTLQTGSIFFLLAFGMIVRWRAGMFLDYRKLIQEEPAAAR